MALASLKELKNYLTVTANDYWHYHYVFDETAAFRKKNLGSQMTDSILINSIAPVVFAYGHYTNDDQYKNKALQWLEQIAAEKNSITKGYALLGVENKNAFDSQALLHLKKTYCDKKHCLDCAIGNGLLKKTNPIDTAHSTQYPGAGF